MNIMKWFKRESTPTLFNEEGLKIIEQHLNRARIENAKLELLGFKCEVINGEPNRGIWFMPDGTRVSRNHALTIAGLPRTSYLSGIELPDELK